MVVPEPPIAARDVGLLTRVAALALVAAVHALSGGALRPGIKWVNDVLLEGRKIVNVATAPHVAATAFVPSVGCLAEAGTTATLAEVTVCVLAAVGRRLGEAAFAGAASLLATYRDASAALSAASAPTFL